MMKVLCQISINLKGCEKAGSVPEGPPPPTHHWLDPDVKPVLCEESPLPRFPPVLPT